MSYARWSNSDVYVYSDGEVIVCCNDDFRSASRAAALAHMEEHIARGEDVGTAAERLRDEIARVGDDVAVNPWTSDR